LGYTEDQNNVSGQGYDEWPLGTWVDSPIFLWLTDTFLSMLVNKTAEYPKPDEGEASNEMLLHELESLKCTMHGALPPQKAVLFCPLSDEFGHLKWWLTNRLADNLDIVYMFAEMGNNEHTETLLKFQDLPNPSVFATTPKVGRIGLNLTAANHAVIT